MNKIITIAFIALMAMSQVNAQNTSDKNLVEMITNIPKISEFPIGEENTAYAQYFTGKIWYTQLTNDKDLNVPLANVTFEPGCRNNWHSHTGGQLLIVVGGEGLYQERGKPARHLKAGDIVEIAPNVVHWHGATANSWFSHLYTNGSPATNENNWLERVTDEDYTNANKTDNK